MQLLNKFAGRELLAKHREVLEGLQLLQQVAAVVTASATVVAMNEGRALQYQYANGWTFSTVAKCHALVNTYLTNAPLCPKMIAAA